VSEEEQPFLFKKFSRLSARPTGGESSHGLGLMLVKRLVVAMEGSVHYERRQPTGSVFIVRLKA
jgi:signal transduction histidine kinase